MEVGMEVCDKEDPHNFDRNIVIKTQNLTSTG